MFEIQGIFRMKAITNGKSGRLHMLLMATALTLASAQTQAAPGPLSQVPLFLAQGVQPNIFFLLDDSGSMDWEVLLRSGGGGSGNLDFDPSTNTDNNLEHCLGYNAMAYNPTNTYTPWSGVDFDGNAFADQSVTKARVNPYTGDGDTGACDNNGVVNNTDGRTCDLLNDFNDFRVTGKAGAFYIPWNDDGDGVYENGECSTNVASRVYVQDLSAAQQTNYANWFSYYRKREYVMKRAVSQIIAESRDRLGLAVINNLEYDPYWRPNWSDTNMHLTKHTHVGTQVRDVDDLTLPIDAQAVTNKAELLDNLLGINSVSGTPLRRNLQLVGEYFSNNLSDTSWFGDTPDNDSDSAAGYSPILNADLGGTCQQNFAVLLSDGFWNGSDPVLGNIDADDPDNLFDGQSYADTANNTLADVAMSLYKGDLLTALDNQVPAVSIQKGSNPLDCFDADGNRTQECYDTNAAQHLVTFTVSFGVTGTIPKTDASGNPCLPGNRTDGVVAQGWPSSCGAAADGWPTPVSNGATTADDMKHAAWNGRGLYLDAKDPDELINRLQQAISDISARKPVSASAVAVDTFNVVNGGAVYQGRFDAGSWSGELYAREITATTIGNQLWAGHTLLDGMDINDRILVTFNGSQGVPFVFPADYQNLGTSDLSAAHINDLLYSAPNSIATTDTTEKSENTTYGVSLVAYLRGDTSNEGTGLTNFRERSGHRLGDIIHSSPVYVGNPDPDLYPDTIAAESYQTWANNLTSDPTDPGANGRQDMIYVGANDGALHAFNAETGVEIFAYYPQAVFSNEERLGLHWLANPNYEHRYYVDIEPALGEVYVNTGDSDGLTWRTVLVGGLRGGGRAMYAIDVSDPTEFSDASGVAGNILWEFSHPDLGYTYSKPTIVKLNDGRWAAIFGNGYNQADTSATGRAALFIRYLDTASPSYRVLYTTQGSIVNGDCLNAGSSCNGLGTPAVVDLGADRVADRVYAGDVQGNLWVFDLSSSNPSNWRSDSDASPLVINTAPLFVASYVDTNGDTQRQPITTQPIVTLHPTERHDATRPNTMVFFGTGQYMAENDPITNGTNTFYGIWDSGSPITLDRSAADPVLVEQTVTTDTLAGKEVRLISNNPVNYEYHKGWFIDLPDEGERVIVNPIVFADLVIYTTMVPYSNVCSDSAGYSWLMVHNLSDGSEPDFIALDVTGNGVFDGSDQIGDHNVGGVKSGDLYWQPTLVKSGPGAIGTLLLPTDGDSGGGGSGGGSGGGLPITETLVQGRPSIGIRSSWGIFRHDD